MNTDVWSIPLADASNTTNCIVRLDVAYDIYISVFNSGVHIISLTSLEVLLFQS
jgi:hypothetical protein